MGANAEADTAAATGDGTPSGADMHAATGSNVHVSEYWPSGSSTADGSISASASSRISLVLELVAGSVQQYVDTALRCYGVRRADAASADADAGAAADSTSWFTHVQRAVVQNVDVVVAPSKSHRAAR